MSRPTQTPHSFPSLTFDNRFTRDLPADPIETNSRRQVHKACFSRVRPQPVSNPRLVAFSRSPVEDQIAAEYRWVLQQS